MRFSTEFTRRCCSILAFVWITIQSAQSQQHNTIDARGLKQGEWIIQGMMLKDPLYSPASKVEEGVYIDNEKEGILAEWNGSI